METLAWLASSAQVCLIRRSGTYPLGLEDHPRLNPLSLLRNLLLVGGGGFLGSVARYLLGGLVLRATGAPRFPLATLTVNVTGCLAIGAIAGLAERAHLFSPAARLFLITGLLGGYTTFSAFAYETFFLAREHAWVSAPANVLAQVAIGLAAVWIGYRIAIVFIV